MKRIPKNCVAILSGLILLVSSCTKSNSTDTSSSVPTVTVNLTLSLNTAPYASLASVGGVAYLTNVGYRGILLYRLSTTTVMAYDRTCTYDLPDANGIVYAQTNGTALCLDCNSAYNLSDGSVSTGPTTMGLKVYTTKYNLNTGILTITN